MRGSAAPWFSQIAFPSMKWVEFKEIFLSRFDTLETCAATVLKMISGKPRENECLAAYASRLFTSLMSRWGNSGKEENNDSICYTCTPGANRASIAAQYFF